MSFEALLWAQRVKVPAHGPGIKATLCALASFADERNSCYPGQETIAEITNQSVRSVRDHIGRLETLGLLRREHRYARSGMGGRTSDRYILLVSGTLLPADTAGKSGRFGGDLPAGTSGKGGDLPATNDRLTGRFGGDLPATVAGLPEAVAGESLEEPLETEPLEEPLAGVTGRNCRKPKSPSHFAEFWAVYPRKDDKARAVKAWTTATRKTSPDKILAGARRYATDPNRDDAYTKHAATWLNAEAWDNGPLPARRNGTPAAADQAQYHRPFPTVAR